MNIGLITWWDGPEREISLISAASTQKWLIELWHTVLTYDIPQDKSLLIKDLSNNSNVFYFVMIHGNWWEDWQIQSLLDIYWAKSQTASANVLALTMNKSWTKAVWEKEKLPVADDILRNPEIYGVEVTYKQVIRSFWEQCVIKETSLWSSKWVHICRSKDKIKKILDLYRNHTQHILIEELLVWDEITIWFLDTEKWIQVLPPILIVPPTDGEFDFKNKYNWKTQEICPAPLDKSILQKAEIIAHWWYLATWCTSYARIDMMLTDRWPVLIEINTIPWFTNKSLYPLAAKTAGIWFNELLQHLINSNI